MSLLISIKDIYLASKYPKGDTFEIRAIIALQYVEQLDVVFKLNDYKFTASGHAGGLLWTQDIHYGEKTNPPPPHPRLGVPIPPQLLKYIRPATDE